MVSTLTSPRNTYTKEPQSKEEMAKTVEDASKMDSERIEAVEALSKWIWTPQENVPTLTDTQKAVLDTLLRVFNNGYKSVNAEKIQCAIARHLFRGLFRRPKETRHVYSYLSGVHKTLFCNPQVSNSIMNAFLY